MFDVFAPVEFPSWNVTSPLVELFNKNEAQWGRWGKLILCPNNTGICGLKTQVEMAQDKSDDTALNNVIFYCCS